MSFQRQRRTVKLVDFGSGKGSDAGKNIKIIKPKITRRIYGENQGDFSILPTPQILWSVVE